MSLLLIQDIRISNAFSATYLDTVNTKDIQSNENFGKLRQIEGFSTIPSNTIYVNTADTRY